MKTGFMARDIHLRTMRLKGNVHGDFIGQSLLRYHRTETPWMVRRLPVGVYSNLWAALRFT